MSRRRPYQFSVLRLLVLSTAIAVTLALAGGIRAPRSIQIGVGIYFALLITWGVMRWPAVYANLREVQRRRQAILAEREAMAAEVTRRKRKSHDG